MSILNYETLLNAKTTYKHVDLEVEFILKSIEKGHYYIPNKDVKYISSKETIINTAFCLIKRIPITPINMYYDDKNQGYAILEEKCQSKIIDIFMYFNGLSYKDDIKKEINFKDIVDIIKEINLLKEKIKDDGVSSDDIQEKELGIDDLYKKLESKYNLVKSEFLVNNSEKLNITYENFNEKGKNILKRKELLCILIQCLSEDDNKTYAEIIKALKQ